MKQRIITGLLASVGVLSLLFLGPMLLIQLVILVFAVLTYSEFEGLMFARPDKNRKIFVSALLVVVLQAGFSSAAAAFSMIWIGFSAIAIRAVILANKKNECASVVSESMTAFLGFTYTLGIFGFFVPIIQTHSVGRSLVLLLWLMVFVGDTMAYFVGVRFGKKKIAENVSPKKSVEGSVAALVSSLLATLIWVLFQKDLPSTLASKLLFIAPIVSMLAQFGDLFESAMKRMANTKDSGQIFPGHGGLLDRLDGLSLSAPVFYCYLQWVLA